MPDPSNQLDADLYSRITAVLHGLPEDRAIDILMTMLTQRIIAADNPPEARERAEALLKGVT